MIKKHYKIWLPILMNILFAVGMKIFVGHYYELSDDWFTARNIVAGNYNITFCSYFIQLLTGLVQKLIYPINAFMLLQIVFGAISLSTIFYVFLDAFKFKRGILFSLIVECLLCVNFYSIITFTKTAAILATAGGLIMLHAFHSKKSIWHSLYGILLVLLGSFYRLKSFYAVLAVFSFCFLAIVLCKVRKPFWGSVASILKDIFTVKTTSLLVAMIVLVFSMNFASTKLMMESDDAMLYYKEYNHLRSTIVDYPLPEYTAYAEELQSIGVSENDYALLQNWYFDDNGYADFETMEKIVAIQKSVTHSPWAIIQRLVFMVATVYNEIIHFSAEGIIILCYLILAVLTLLIYRSKSWVYVCAISFVSALLYAYLWTGGRIKFRAMICIWIAAVVCLLYCARFMEYRRWVQFLLRHCAKVICVVGAVAGVSLCGILLYYTATVTPKQHKIVNYYDYTELSEYITSNEEIKFALSYNGYKFLRNATVLKDPLYIGPDPVFDRCIFYGSPYYAHPYYLDLLEDYGVACLYTDIIDDENFYFVDRKNSDIAKMMAYLNEQYGVDEPYTCELITILDEHYLYRIRTGGTNKIVVIENTLEDVTVPAGEKAILTVDAYGEGLTYSWYFANPGSDNFLQTETFKENKYYIDMEPSRNGRRVYCVVTDAYGNSVQTEIATLNME